jgi:hypothetical protein
LVLTVLVVIVVGLIRMVSTGLRRIRLALRDISYSTTHLKSSEDVRIVSISLIARDSVPAPQSTETGATEHVIVECGILFSRGSRKIYFSKGGKSSTVNEKPKDS